MMLTIHGLPLHVKYQNLKSLIKEKCNISDYILDNLVSEGDGTKKVRIGLADEREGSYLIKCLDGLRIDGNILRVAPVGRPPQSVPQQNFDQRGGFPPRNDYSNTSVPNYGQPNHTMEQMGRPDIMRSEQPRQEQWGPGNDQWGTQQQQGPNQMNQGPQNSYNYQQSQGINAPYGQQHAQGPGPDIRPHYDQRDQYQGQGRMPPHNQSYNDFPKNDLPDPVIPRRMEGRAHVLRSVEIIDEPLARPAPAPAPPQRYPAAYDHSQHKPITIMKENFQGPQYNADRPAQYQGGPQTHAQGPALQAPGHMPHPGPAQPPVWSAQPIQQDKALFAKPGPNSFDRKYPEPEKRPMMEKPAEPRFPPRRDVPDSSGRRMQSPGRRMPSPGRIMSSPGRRMPSPGRRLPSPGRRIPSPGRRMPSPGRRMPSPGRRMPSPGRRIPSPGRRMPSPGRRMPSPGRRMPSPGRRMSSPGRRMPSPGRRMPSPGKRTSPGRRRDSPPLKRHDSPGMYSSGRRHMEKPIDKYGSEGRSSLKDVRPAYDASSQAPNQAMYSGGYRPSLHENVQYPIAGARQPESRSSWQDKATFSGGVKKDDDRRMPKFEPRIDAMNVIERSPRKSRSPVRRDRSPLRDRFKKRSPSPRSPRRSWALEKRRSPEVCEAPPPPMWPGQSRNEEPFKRFPERVEEEKKHVPVWEPRRLEDERTFENPLRVRTDLGRPPREPSPRSGYKPEGRFPPRQPRFEPVGPKFEPRDPKFEPRDPKFEPREPKFEPRVPKFEPRDPKFEPRDPKFERGPKFELREEFRRSEEISKRFERDFREPQRLNDDVRPGGRPDRREEFAREEIARRVEERKNKMPETTLNMEIEDVYKRAQELNKRAEELRRREERRRDELERRDTGRELNDFNRKFNPREDTSRHEPGREPDWKTDDRRNYVSPVLKAKREKAIEEISNKIVDKHGAQFTGLMKTRVLEEMKLIVSKVLQEIFGYNDVSFIEMVVKFNAKYDAEAEFRMYKDVLASLPSHFRTTKRPANEHMDASGVPAKSVKHNHEGDINRGVSTTMAKGTYIPDWQPNPISQDMVTNLPPPALYIPNPYDMVHHMGMLAAQPVMVPPPSYDTQDRSGNRGRSDFQFAEKTQPSSQDDETHNLFLCKEDFEPFSENQAEYLKKFLVAQLVNACENSQGWSPDFTLKGLQSLFRYEVETRDEATKDWFLHLDFSEFQLFNVLVYTKEELWYERAAIWLPGHSRVRNIEPLAKLKLQNKKLAGVNIGKWKLVKKIVQAKGTRIYVDMPPSSARALENNKMLLSYELQKVSVFLKAVAVDKEVFDAGLRALSLTDTAEITAATQNSPMPSLGNHPDIIKICLKGNKTLTVEQARKIKDMLIYQIFRYHQSAAGGLTTDFEKFGYCLPGYFGVVPENSESKQWLMSLNIGKLNRHAVVVLGAEDTGTKHIKMIIVLNFAYENSNNLALIFERLKQSNKGVKGLNFKLWKPLEMYSERDHRGSKNLLHFELEMDLESVEMIMNKLKSKLDYVDSRHKQHSVPVKYHDSKKRLEDVIKEIKAEMCDSYDVANMDIASSDDDDDIVYIGEVN